MVLIREGKKQDCVYIEAMIREFAEFNGKPEGPKINAQQLEQDGFCEQYGERLFKLYVAQLDEEREELIGYVLFYDEYSLQYGKCIWMEDLYIRPEHRGDGIGTQLLSALSKYALDNNYACIDWECFGWNEASIRFYKRSGAIEGMTGLSRYVLEKEDMKQLAIN